MSQNQLGPVLALVLPMYNVRDYIEECLESIYSQRESQRVEVILVDDGSPDDSAEVAEKWLRKHADGADWKIIRQDNKGLGGARNTGIDASTAQYIWFVDTDDIITDNSLTKLLPMLDGCDVLAFCGSDLLEDGTIKRSYNLKEGNVCTGIDLLFNCPSVNAPYNIVRRAFLNQYNLRFKEHLLHEDSEFTPRMRYFAASVRETDEIFYAYRSNPESITHSIRPSRSFDLLRVSRSLYDFAKPIENKRVCSRIMQMSATALNGAIGNSEYMDKEMKAVFKEQLMNNLDLIGALRNSDLRYHRLQGMLYSLSPKHIMRMHSFLSRMFR